jgi:phage terminase large subunit
MAEWIGNHPIDRILADPQSAQLITELRQAYGLGIVQPADKQEISVGIERITALLKEGRLKIFNTCKNTIEEFSVYHYPRPDEDKVTKDKPVDKNNHAMDALRYTFNKPIETGFYKKQEAVKGINAVTGY